MKHLFLVLLAVAATLVSATSCGPDDPVADDPLQIELPVVAECGAIPEGPWVLTIRIAEDGDIYVPGESVPMGIADLRRYLDTRWEEQGPEGRDPEEAPGLASSRTHLLLRADARVPWPIVAWTLIVCDEGGRIYRISLACVCSLDRAEGAVAFPFRASRIMYSGSTGTNPTTEWCVNFWSSSTHRCEADSIVRALAGVPPDVLRSTRFDIVAADSRSHGVPWGDVLDLAVALRRGGAERIALGAPFPPRVREFGRDQQLSWLQTCETGRLSYDAQTLVRYPVPPDRVPALSPRRHDGPWGIPRGAVVFSPCNVDEEDVQEVEEPGSPDREEGDR